MEIKKEHEKIRSRRHSILLEKEFLKYKLKKKTNREHEKMSQNCRPRVSEVSHTINKKAPH